MKAATMTENKNNQEQADIENGIRTLSVEAQGITALPQPAPLRHIGLYGYTAGFLRRFPALPPAPLEQIESLEQLRVLWHGERIVVHLSPQRPGPGVDTPEDLARVRRIFEQRSSADTR